MHDFDQQLSINPKMEFATECVIGLEKLSLETGVIVRSQDEMTKFYTYYYSSVENISRWLQQAGTCPLTRSRDVEYFALSQLRAESLSLLTVPANYELCPMSDLPTIGPDKNKLYIAVQNGSLVYSVLTPSEETQQASISQEALGVRDFNDLQILLPKILLITSTRGHTYRWQLKASEQIANTPQLVELLNSLDWTKNRAAESSIFQNWQRMILTSLFCFGSLNPIKHLIAAIMACCLTLAAAGMVPAIVIATVIYFTYNLVATLIRLVTCQTFLPQLNNALKITGLFLGASALPLGLAMIAVYHAGLALFTLALSPIVVLTHYFTRKNNFEKVKAIIPNLNKEAFIPPEIVQKIVTNYEVSSKRRFSFSQSTSSAKFFKLLKSDATNREKSRAIRTYFFEEPKHRGKDMYCNIAQQLAARVEI